MSSIASSIVLEDPSSTTISLLEDATRGAVNKSDKEDKAAAESPSVSSLSETVTFRGAMSLILGSTSDFDSARTRTLTALN